MRLVQTQFRLVGVVDVAHERIKALRRQRKSLAASVRHRNGSRSGDAAGSRFVAYTRYVSSAHDAAAQSQDVISVR